MVQQRKNQSYQSKNKSCLIGSALDKKYSELLTYEHQSILVTLVINIQALESAYESLNSVGATYITDNGMIKKNPAVDVITNTTTKILSASTALGFSPASRASLINLAQVDSEDSASKLMEMFADDE
ncbi:P27 family phage terminase small subunit [Leuconostoc pseudomesenteroides]|uniref:P27 family phage terminase small subunit n=1 Tax=Leuconostoc pseudomesenteroides TaxID=33968 RepID=UPI001F553E88|nr:P27 family phage terminase small subunit [Leuconostoc pseudomesenteroides]